MGKDHPHLLASCICNAARSLGKVFGRDINRKDEDNYTAYYSEIAEAEEASEKINWKAATTREALVTIWNEHPALHKNSAFLKKFKYYNAKLTAKK